MYIKRYSFAALLLIFGIGWFVYGFVSKESMHITVLGIVLPSLPVAVWVSAAMLLLFAATILHMFFYSFVGSMRLRKYEKDYQLLLEAFADAFLKKPEREHRFKTPRYSLMGRIIDLSDLEPGKGLEHLDHPKLSLVAATLQQIEAGESVDLKRFNLPATNPFVIRNQYNQLQNGELEPETILAKPDRYDALLHAEAYETLVRTTSLPVIEKYRRFMTFSALLSILERINAEENTLSVPNATIVDFIEKVDGLSPLDYLHLAVITAEHMLPEQRIAIMETLSDRDEKALDGYIFTLFDLEMVDKARDLLPLTSEGEYTLFKAYADLKECNRHYDIKIFAKMMLLNYEPRV